MLYADIDGFDPTRYALKDCKLTVMDKWILSSLHSLVAAVDEGLASYKITESARAVGDFTDALSNWYVRRCRERYWGNAMTEDKKAAYMTLYTVLETLTRLAAPFTPFICESIYQNIVRGVNKNAPVSVHLCPFPVCDKKAIDKKLESDMAVVLEAATLGRSARNASKIKNRQPLGRLLLAGEGAKRLNSGMKAVIADELNVKTVETIDGAAEYVSYEVKPQLKTLGPKYGKLIGAIREYLAAHGEEAVKGVRGGKTHIVRLSDAEVCFTDDDLLVKVVSREGYAAESGELVTCVLDTALTPELINEGYVRELISKIQAMRKEAGFAVTDHIAVGVSGDPAIVAAVNAFADKLKAAVLADAIVAADGGVSVDVNGKTCVLSVTKQ